MCDNCKHLEDRLDALEKALFMVIRSEPRWNAQFCSDCNEPATQSRSTMGPESHGYARWVPHPVCDTHAEWFDRRMNKER